MKHQQRLEGLKRRASAFLAGRCTPNEMTLLRSKGSQNRRSHFSVARHPFHIGSSGSPDMQPTRASDSDTGSTPPPLPSPPPSTLPPITPSGETHLVITPYVGRSSASIGAFVRFSSHRPDPSDSIFRPPQRPRASRPVKSWSIWNANNGHLSREASFLSRLSSDVYPSSAPHTTPHTTREINSTKTKWSHPFQAGICSGK